MPVREIDARMIKILDWRLKTNGLVKHSITIKEPRLLMIEAAKCLLDVREEGNNQGSIVKLLQETIGTAQQEPWCLSLVQTLIAYCELRIHMVSRIMPTEHVLTMWNHTPKTARVKVFPLPGALVVWQHGDTQAGHTGIFLEGDGKTMTTIEGNTTKGLAPDGSIIREGGGIYLCERSMIQDGEMKVVGFLKPF